MRFEDLSQKQMEEICSGCGSKGSLIKPPYAAFFETNCNKHDYSYYVGCIEEDRKKADVGLRKAMAKDSLGTSTSNTNLGASYTMWPSVWAGKAISTMVRKRDSQRNNSCKMIG